RHRYTPDQLSMLEASFAQSCRPSREEKRRLAERLNVQVNKIQIWFQNRRAQCKR
ncbi:homeobox domain-containing protein, partial [Zychaea mexicana]|uniref:homeobox domain-containing protein n=1 Tax=Zychaea mexicana TaxID=64656 RepID=UPI0022FEB457